jgi:hypothetical protein
VGNERAKLAYEVFRSGLRYPDDIPTWDDAPSWVRDAVIVAYLQGLLDAPCPVSPSERSPIENKGPSAS